MDRHQIDLIERDLERMRENDAELFEEFKRNPNSENIPAGLRDIFRRRLMLG